MRAIGLMSGTSMDGIDIALIETDGAEKLKRGPAGTTPYDAKFRAALAQAMAEARSLADRRARTPHLAWIEQELTDAHAAVVADFLRAQALRPADIAVIGFHGHTVLHRPELRLTVQLGDGDRLAHATGIDVVHDLRAADIEAGGQGAPLAPVYHRALAGGLPERPVVMVNIGGVANVTWIGRDGSLIAFDTGPGNALIDDWTRRHAGRAMDEGGALAAEGKVDEGALIALLTHDYFCALPPKSLDRNAFRLDAVAHLSPADGAATLTAFTAASLARAREHFPEEPRLWVISGGGRRNKTLMAMIAGRVEGAVAPAEAAGVDGDAMEAEAWAYLAVRSLRRLPITFPGTTGVPRPMTGGALATKP
ncbi:MAG: anhydro-N-acetylmuramic acid kinase [Hyphomicrobiaceae bacterium]|nr:MAG: anhydro-N-acetylmuramic acid kinase [Hyphomicrobiaceae bacterium]